MHVFFVHFYPVHFVPNPLIWSDWTKRHFLNRVLSICPTGKEKINKHIFLEQDSGLIFLNRTALSLLSLLLRFHTLLCLSKAYDLIPFLPWNRSILCANHRSLCSVYMKTKESLVFPLNLPPTTILCLSLPDEILPYCWFVSVYLD